MQDMSTKLHFSVQEKLKTSRPGNHLEPIEIKAYPSELQLCPVTHIRHYLTQTRPLRQDSKLFISLLKPYKPVTPATIGRWIKSMLTEAGINTKQYSAHSSRTASSAFALSSGLAIKDILKAGGWSRVETFAKHYNKPINPNFGSHIQDHAQSTTQHTANDL